MLSRRLRRGVVVAVASAADRVELSWGAASDNVGVTGYEVERCLGAGCTDFGLVATTSSVGYVDGSVAAAATYRFRVRARDAAGNVGGYADAVTVTTPAGPDVDRRLRRGLWLRLPRRLTGLSWSGAASDNVGVTGYEVERCLGAGCTDFGLVATTSSVGYVDGSVAAAATYRFRVRARDAAGNVGGYADAVTVTTPAGPDVEPPSAPGVVVAVASAADRVELSWGAASDNVGVTGYEVERCLGAGCTDFGLLATTSSVGYVDGSVAAAATYRFRVRARDAAGNVGGYADAVTVTTPAGPDVEPPSAPGVVVAVASAADRVELSWGAASDNVGVTGYEVERCLGAGCTDFGLLATTSSVGYVDGSVAGGCDVSVPGACGGCGRQPWPVLRTRRRRPPRAASGRAWAGEGGADGALSRRPERCSVPDQRRVASGADRRPDGIGCRALLREPAGARVQHGVDQLAL